MNVLLNVHYASMVSYMYIYPYYIVKYTVLCTNCYEYIKIIMWYIHIYSYYRVLCDLTVVMHLYTYSIIGQKTVCKLNVILGTIRLICILVDFSNIHFLNSHLIERWVISFPVMVPLDNS